MLCLFSTKLMTRAEQVLPGTEQGSRGKVEGRGRGRNDPNNVCI
jgi:hypothetical protein